MTTSTTKLIFNCGDWKTLGDQCYIIRDKVFLQEQNFPVEEEIDKYDHKSVHFLISEVTVPTKTTDKDDETEEEKKTEIQIRHAATGRLTVLDDKETGKVGRICCLKEFRGTGVGKFLLDTIIDHAKKTPGLKRLTLDTQEYAMPFYAKHGFVAHGPLFFDNEVPHYQMSMEI